MEGHGRHTPIGSSYRIAVVGLGEGKGLIKGLDGHPELTVQAICDIDKNSVERVQKQFHIPEVFTNLDTLLAESKVDIIAIYTPDQLHIEHIRKSLEGGKHVLCTKPLVNSLREAKEVVDLTRMFPDLQLMVGQSSRFFGSMQYQRKAFEEGKLGELSYVEAHYVHDMRWFYGNRPWAREGGFDLLFGGCSHPVDLVRWYMGDVEEVFAYANRSLIGEEANFQGEDTFVISLKFKNGKIGRVLGMYGLEHPHQTRPWIEVGVYGTDGTFISKYPQLESIVKLKGENERIESYFEDSYHYFQFEGINHHAGEFVNYMEYFSRCITKGEKTMPDAEDGFKTIATLEAIRESIKTGKPEKVSELTTSIGLMDR
ncbi:Gfo/Idh/MocA family protein [Pseudalkalibacillus caeni]|uniref:Gfo/Idh/MocA family oxidoreductase n=1 Tax=Exobacillus caeni TaxID=2574798 RepID=A0A5R9FFP8_9BACL|nr:Gfo/Idh/MocA family oxidoreductase [Pseudalkalibacillus caeni]TLS38385.1 Gfo/Idh/MocA family oxidoreductase [Pseudalkalibacillus caeni]